MKVHAFIELLRQQLAAAAAAGENPDLMEICLYCPEENTHNDWWEITGAKWELGTPSYIEIAGTPQDE